MEKIKHIITEHWEEELLRNLVGDEEIATLKYSNSESRRLDFNPKTEYLEITVKRIPK